MADLPSGTLTFLFTDIEGSTRLLQTLGEKFTPLLAKQQELFQGAFETHHGSVVRIAGDSFFVAFPNATDAVKAAVQCQLGLHAQTWTNGVKVQVRMGLHTGEAQVSLADYVGIDVHRAARIAAVAHGGQVLLSQTTYDLVESDLSLGVTIRDLGEHRLKDLRRPKHLYQLVIAGLPSDFPPLRSLEASPNNLPFQLTSFIGRSKEITETKQLLLKERLLTLTGPGGSGKTRLALQVAADLIERFRDGVFFVGLAPITDPGLVAPTIAHQLGVTEATGQSIVQNLKDYLKGKSVLLVIDNFEQVISAAPLVAELLAACSELKVLVTSRESLRISGEQEYPVPPLEFPDLNRLPSAESLSQYAAVDLFVQRSQAVKPDFRITSDAAQAVAEICCRLDGMPLAIELAAARIKLFPPRAMLSRLEHRLEFLTSGPRDLPARQQTLRNTIAWSYELLGESEQKLFRRLSVFVGGCTVEAVEAVAEDQANHIALLDLFESLLNKSLLREGEGTNGEPRYWMLELLREFGLEQLEASGEIEAIRYRHAIFGLALAEEAEARLESSDQVEWMNRLEQEHDNLRAALEWSETAEGAGEICLRLASSLGTFWVARGYASEGRERFSAILLMEAAQGQTAARARILARAAELAFRQSDYPATINLAGESLAIWREVGDWQGIAEALLKIGNAVIEGGDYARASDLYEEALKIWQEQGEKHGTLRALISLGWLALRAGDYGVANERLQEALSISRQLGDKSRIGMVLSGLGEVSLRQGDYGQATRLLEESLALRSQVGNKWGVGVSLGTLGWIDMRQGEWNRAVARLGESLEVRQEIGDKGGSAWCLERLADIAMVQGQFEKAVRLLGAASALRESIGSVIDPVDRPEYDSRRTDLHTKLGIQRFAALWEEGRALTVDQAAELALENRSALYS